MAKQMKRYFLGAEFALLWRVALAVLFTSEVDEKQYEKKKILCDQANCSFIELLGHMSNWKANLAQQPDRMRVMSCKEKEIRRRDAHFGIHVNQNFSEVVNEMLEICVLHDCVMKNSARRRYAT